MTDPMTTPPLDLTALREYAEECLGASGGEWTHEPYGGQNQNGDYSGGHVFDMYGEYLISDVTDVDGAHIAAFDPPTVLALLDRVEDRDAQRSAKLHAMRMVAEYKARAEAAEAVIRHVRAARDEFDKNGSLAFLQMELDRALDGTA